jgi:hypothetical protein
LVIKVKIFLGEGILNIFCIRHILIPVGKQKCAVELFIVNVELMLLRDDVTEGLIESNLLHKLCLH